MNNNDDLKKKERISKIHSLSSILKGINKNNNLTSNNSITIDDIEKLNSNFNDKNGNFGTVDENIDQDKYYKEFIRVFKSNYDNSNNNVSNNNVIIGEKEPEQTLISDTDSSNYNFDSDSSKDALDNEEGTYNENKNIIDSSSNNTDKKRRIPEIQHDKHNYPKIIKNFYREVNELKKLKQHEVDHIRVTNNGIHIKKIKNKNNASVQINSIKPILNFSQCGLPLPINNYLKKKGISKPFPIQMQSIPILMSGHDLIGIAETGSGKTFAYVLPLIRHVLVQINNDYPFSINNKSSDNSKYIKGLIIVPTRELALQVYKQTKKVASLVNLSANIICGGLGISQQLNKIRSGTDIIIGTPGRIIDIMILLYKKIHLFQYISFMVIDEGDRLFDMGFAPQLLSIISIIRPDRQIAIFSATFPNVIEQFTNRILENPIQIVVGKKGQTNHNVKQYIELYKNENELFLRLLQLLGEWSEFGLIVIFCNRQTEVDELFAKLIPYGYNCLTLHSGQDHYDRHSNLTTFSKTNVNSNPPPPSGQNILIATSIFSRGLHIDNILLVINYGAPHHIEDYIHRIGRTGRAGNFGTSFTLLLPNEIPHSSDLIELAIKNSSSLNNSNAINCETINSDDNNSNGNITIDLELVNIYNNMIKSNNYSNINDSDSNNYSNSFSNNAESVRKIKKRIKNFGFGGKGFKFSKDEKNSLQILKDDTKKALGLIPDNNSNITEESIIVKDKFDIESNNSNNNSDIHNNEIDKNFKTCNVISNNHIASTSSILPNNLHQVVDGRVIGIFEINDYPTHIRQKIVHKDIIKSVNDNCGVICQVKGIYIPPDPSLSSLPNIQIQNTRNSKHISDKKKLYIEINGPNHLKVQKAIQELNLTISSIKFPQIIKPSHSTGKYTLTNLLKK
ncbi:hypothetical protein FG379_001598 [Cryptosporidium bovis]|uniref:uncharacterized protein n=1 Tax=Cryptosporidium bovis TaxID=310047 RepID=UPI003519F92B|nr:hypothetical protein FG379_001598 [Cryptosporidium bovis]